MNKDKKIIFGLGTGRCGTMSLSRLLSYQENSIVSHELGGLPWLSWEKQEGLFKTFIGNIFNRQSRFIGDVSFYSLPYWKNIVNLDPKSKFIIIKRDKDETVKSYMKKTNGRNHWIQHDGSKWRKDVWDKCYPKFETENKEEALELYYEHYYKMCEQIPNELTYWIDTEDLNNKEKCLEMLKWCGFEEPKYAIMKKNEGKK